MLSVEEIRNLLSAGRFTLSRHALRRLVERNVSEMMIRSAGATVTIIEDYPDDKYSPSCLMLGFSDNQPLHVQVLRAANPFVHIMTLYVPSLDLWESRRRRDL